MALLDVRIYGDPCLKEMSTPVEEFGEALSGLVQDMYDTLYHTRGIGLAAAQVGLNIRLFVMDVEWVDREEEERPEKNRKDPRTYINPEIVWEDPQDEATTEGCLSLPGLEGEVYRPVSIRAKWLDENGQAHEETMTDLKARCFQHELDHLNGVLFIDRMPFIKRRLLAGKLSNLKKKNLEAVK
jgi:peptide deformylase